MAEQKYLRKMGEGTIFGWTEALEGRGDMIPCDKDGNRMDIDFIKKDILSDTVEMEIMGKKQDIPSYLVDAVKELIASKTPETVKESRTEMVLNGNTHQVPDSMVMDIKSLSDRMVEATKATAGLQAQISKAIKENKELEKDRDRIKEERTIARREATNLKKKLDALE